MAATLAGTASELEEALIDVRVARPGFIPSLAARGDPLQFVGVSLHRTNKRFHAQHLYKTLGTGASDLEAALIVARARNVTAAVLLKCPGMLNQILVKVDAEAVVAAGMIGRKRKRVSHKMRALHAVARSSLRRNAMHPPLADGRGVGGSPMSPSINADPSSQDVIEDSERFQAIMNVYRDQLPADIEHSILVRQNHPTLPAAAPVLHMACMLGKEPSFQNIIVSLWLSNKSGCKTLRGQHSVLVQAARLQAKQACDDPRSRKTCTLNLSTLGLGWLSTFQFWGIIEKDACGDVCVAGKSYAVAPWSSELQASLQLVLDAAVALNDLEVPRTLLQWQVGYQSVTHKINFPGAATSKYVKPWVVRMRMIVEMRALGISQLDAKAPMSVAEFATLFPDQCNWVHRFGSRHDTIQSVWAAQQYDSPPELYTMYTCFAGSPIVQRFPAAWLRDCEMHLKCGRAGYRAAWGWNPIPAVLLPIVHNAIANTGPSTRISGVTDAKLVSRKVSVSTCNTIAFAIASCAASGRLSCNCTTPTSTFLAALLIITDQA